MGEGKSAEWPARLPVPDRRQEGYEEKHCTVGQ